MSISLARFKQVLYVRLSKNRGLNEAKFLDQVYHDTLNKHVPILTAYPLLVTDFKNNQYILGL